MTDRVLRKKWQIVFIGTVLLLFVFSPCGLEMYDDFADKAADPGYLGNISPEYLGGWYFFWVSECWPESYIVINFNTSKHNENITLLPDTEKDIYFSCRDYWTILEQHGPDVFERVRISLYWYVAHYKMTVHYDPFRDQYYEVDEFLCWGLEAYDSWLSEPEYYDVETDLTLFFDWRGWI